MHTIASICVTAAAAAVLLITNSWPTAAEEDSVLHCDRLASGPHDANAAAPTVTWTVLGRSWELAVESCREAVAANPDEPRLRYQLARALDAGEQYDEAIEIYKPLIEAGYAAAMADLSVLMATGKGVEADPQAAIELAGKAASAGNLRGETMLGAFNFLGVGMEANPQKAAGMLEAAAERGSFEAMEFLGDLHATSGKDRSSKLQALEWYGRAANGGRLRAAMTAAQIAADYPERRGSSLDWLALAARAGHVPAMPLLAGMLLGGQNTRPDFSAAVYWFERAAANGHKASHSALARLYETDQFGLKDLELARDWYEKGVAASDPSSAHRLARGIDRGQFEGDPAQTIEFILLAVELGDRGARDELMAGLDENWSEPSRMALQQHLADKGLYDGAIDGESGPATRAAAEALLSRE